MSWYTDLVMLIYNKSVSGEGKVAGHLRSVGILHGTTVCPTQLGHAELAVAPTLISREIMFWLHEQSQSKPLLWLQQRKPGGRQHVCGVSIFLRNLRHVPWLTAVVNLMCISHWLVVFWISKIWSYFEKLLSIFPSLHSDKFYF